MYIVRKETVQGSYCCNNNCCYTGCWALCHLQDQRSSENISSVFISLSGLEDAELIIQSGNSSQLAYSIDIVTRTPVVDWGFLQHEDDTTNGVIMYFNFDTPTKQVTITLCPSVKYTMNIDGLNLNTSILGSSTSNIERIDYQSTGNLTLFLNQCNSGEDSMVFDGHMGEYPDYVSLFIDLPLGFEGEVECSGPGPIYVVDNIGWSFDGDHTFSSGSADSGLYVTNLYAETGYLLWLY